MFSLAVGIFFIPLGAFAKCGLHCSESQQIVDSLASVQNLIPQSQSICVENKTSGDAPTADAARLLMTQIYGSCDVLKLPVREKEFLVPHEISSSVAHVPVYDGNRYPRTAVALGQVSKLSESHPYLHSFQNGQSCEGFCENKLEESSQLDPKCVKATCLPVQNPPTYQYGAKSNDPNLPFAVQRKGKGVSNGIDCSGFVSDALMLKGLRMVPNQKPSQQGTGMIASFGSVDAQGSAKDCFDNLSRQSGVQAGDILVAPNNHVVIIDSVGKDPFGLSSLLEQTTPESMDQQYLEWVALKKQKPVKGSLVEILGGKSTLTEVNQSIFLNQLADSLCQKQVDINQFQITIIHSSPHGNRVGVQRERASIGLEGPLETHLEMKARRDCIETLKEKWKVLNPSLVINPSKTVTMIQGTAKSHASPKLLRHRSDRTGCVGDPIAPPSISCSTCCDLKTNYSDLVPEIKR